MIIELLRVHLFNKKRGIFFSFYTQVISNRLLVMSSKLWVIRNGLKS
jgi:hypothetical protein